MFALLALLLPLCLSLPSFPGAIGFGTETAGGRGGKVFTVQNTAGSGAGSLRAALEATVDGPRTIVFAVGGTITVDTPLVVPARTTIAGQTAPPDSGGITIRADPVLIEQTVTIAGDDVIIRFVRFRRGASSAPTCCGDCILINDSHNVVLDHVSLSWAVDENINTWASSSNITFLNSISSEALYDSSHMKGPHSMGSIFARGHSASVVRSLFARNVGRNPRLDFDSGIEVVNNLIADTTNTVELAHSEFGQFVPGLVATEANIVGNRFLHYSSRNGVLVRVDDNPYSLYVKDNIGCQRTSTTQPESDIVGNSVNSGDPAPDNYVTTPNNFATHTLDDGILMTHDQVQDYVLAHAGCTRPTRDAVDERVIADVLRMQRTTPVDDPSDVGGWPTLAAGTPRLDTDGDGIPDSFEETLGTSPNNAADGAIITASGYSNLELWLNSAELLGDEFVGELPVSTSTVATANPATSPSSAGESPGATGTAPADNPAASSTSADGAATAGADNVNRDDTGNDGDDDDSSSVLPLYVAIAALAVLVAVLAVALVVSRSSSSSRVKALQQAQPGGTRLSSGARRRSSHYRAY